MEEKIRIALAVTTLKYEKKCVDGLLQLANADIFSAFCVPDIALLPIARNNAIQMIYTNLPDFTHVLFIDDDMCGFQTAHVLKLIQDTIELNCHMVSALVTQRNPPYRMVAQFTGLNEKEVYTAIKEQKVLESTHLGMAFTLITREVLDATREETDGNPIWFTLDRWPRFNYEAELADRITNTVKRIEHDQITIKRALYSMASFGEQAHRGSELIGEDIEFCKRVQKLGFKTWVDCGVVVGHLGLVPFDFRHALMEAHREKTDEKN